MSDKVRALVWSFYEEEQGAKMITMIALADEADDRGGGIFQSISELAKKTRQSRRGMQTQLRAIEDSGLLECVERSSGGPGKFSQYRLVLDGLVSGHNPAQPARLGDFEPRTACTVNRAPGARLDLLVVADHSIRSKPTTKYPEPCKSSTVHFTVLDQADHQLAAAFFEDIKRLNPGHREPAWKGWLRDIRLMRERDGRTHADIRGMWECAHGDEFWRRQILSPANLRKHWDRLAIKRSSAPRAASPPAQDRRCAYQAKGERCMERGIFGQTDGRWYCAAHYDEIERGNTDGEDDARS